MTSWTEATEARISERYWMDQQLFYNTSSIKATFPRHCIENFKYLLTEGVENKCIQKNKRLLTSD